MTLTSPRVSVIIPTFDRRELVGATIENMERQTLRPHEIIVVDDGSTDGSVEYLESLGDRIRLVVQANQGPGAARNAGLAIATGEFVQFFDSDDLCSLDKIERQARALAETGADLAYGPWMQAWIEDARAFHDGLVVQQGPLTVPPLSAFLRGWICLIPCCVIRRDLLVELGGYPTEARTMEDLELFFRALVAGAKLVHVPEALVLVRQHPGNQLSAAPGGEAMRRRDHARLVRLIVDLLAQNPDVGTARDRLTWRLSSWDALRRADSEAAADVAPAEWAPLLTAAVRLRQMHAGLRRRLTGSRLSRHYATARITARQQASIAALGYAPMRRSQRPAAASPASRAKGPGTVSVVMPCYNRAALIGESIENMLRQSLAPHEVIVVDDGSTDDSIAVIRGFGDRVRLIEQANAGPGAARNAGLAVATGEFVQFFDSDDLCTPDKIERQRDALVASGADVAYSAWMPAWLGDGEARFDGIVRQQRAINRDPLSAYLHGWATLIQCCLIRRDLLVRVGGYPTAKRTGEDLELLFRMILADARLEHVPGPVVLLRQHPDGQISAAPELAVMRADDRIHLSETVWRLLHESGRRTSVADRHLWRTEMWAARHDHPVTPGRQQPVYAATRRARQIRGGLRKRLTGVRRPPFFGPGAMTAAQADAIRAIGYRPVPE